jgi:hypothetical protein
MLDKDISYLIHSGCQSPHDNGEMNIDLLVAGPIDDIGKIPLAAPIPHPLYQASSAAYGTIHNNVRTAYGKKHQDLFLGSLADLFRPVLRLFLTTYSSSALPPRLCILLKRVKSSCRLRTLFCYAPSAIIFNQSF